MTPTEVTASEPAQPASVEGVGPFAEYLEARRNARGWSRSELAAYLGVNLRTLDRWRLGETVPSRAHCTLVRRALDAGPAGEAMDYLARALSALQAATRAPASNPLTRAQAAARKASQ